MQKDIVVVSSNQGKVKEFKNILQPHGFNVISLKDLNIDVDIIEDGKTFEENALIKARYFKDKFDLVVADDSGLEISALDNQPGIHSARFLGKDLDYKIKNKKVIEMLEDKKDRSAKFISVIAYIEDGVEKTFRGEVLGEISKEIMGAEGFGYDPIFIPNGLNKSFGQLSDEEKNKISHRSIALEKFERCLKNEKK